MTKIARTTPTVTFFMVVGLARSGAIEPGGTNLVAQGALVHRVLGSLRLPASYGFAVVVTVEVTHDSALNVQLVTVTVWE
jgi:hypothetical protein